VKEIDEITGIQQELKRLGNSQIARHSQRFFKTGKGEYAEGDIFLGIRVPVLRAVAKRHRSIPVENILQLLQSRFHEERLLSLFMLVDTFKKTRSPETKKAIYRMYLANTRFINNWDLVDCSAEHIVGAFLRQADKQPIYTLAVSDMLWERRIAIMSTFHYIKNNEFEDTLKISHILLNDKEDLIHKAVGWMLREVGKRDIRAEENFLQKYYKKMPRTMLRYAIEKFPEAKRQKYLAGEI
jgi:3-methyladenine DNA glycosylase AlkD